MGVEEASRRLDALIEDLPTTVAVVEGEGGESPEDAEFYEEVAQRNRAGLRGQDWRVLQQRIDDDRTSLDAILGGLDDSPEAIRVRDLSQQNIARLGNEMADQAVVDPEAFDPSASAQELHDDLMRRVKEVKGRFGLVEGDR